MPSQCLLGELCKVFAVWSHQTLCTKLRHFLVLFCKDEIACTISKGNCLHQLPSTKSRTFWSELFVWTKWLMGQRTRCRAIKCLLTFLDAPSWRLAFYLVEHCFFYVLFFCIRPNNRMYDWNYTKILQDVCSEHFSPHLSLSIWPSNAATADWWFLSLGVFWGFIQFSAGIHGWHKSLLLIFFFFSSFFGRL